MQTRVLLYVIKNSQAKPLISVHLPILIHKLPEFFTLPNGGFISVNLKRKEIVKCLTDMTDDYHSSEYVDDQAFLRKHLYLKHITPLILDSGLVEVLKI